MAVQNLSSVPTICDTSLMATTTASAAAIRDSQQLNSDAQVDLSNIFSFGFGRRQYPNQHVRGPSFSMSTRSFWTKYCLLCTVCGSAATILAGIFLVVAALFRYYTTSINYFETVPTYIPAILLSICGVSTIAFSCKRNRNIILLRITACWSLVSAAISSVITISTSLVHMNRLQTLKECIYSKNPPSCTCYTHSFGNFGLDVTEAGAPQYVFENTPDCDVIHGTLYSCLRAVFAISVVAVLLSIFLCMLLYQLIGHERKKAYWSRIRRINSDWSADFIACLARPMPRERSSLMPLMLSPSSSQPPPLGAVPSMGAQPVWGPPPLGPVPPMGAQPVWGPPPSYEEVVREDESIIMSMPMQIPKPIPLTGNQTITIPASATTIITVPSAITTANSTGHPGSSANYMNSDGFLSPHPFSPTITSVDPIALFRQHQENVLSHTQQQQQQQQQMYNNNQSMQRNVCRVHGRTTYSPMRPVIRIIEGNQNQNIPVQQSHGTFSNIEIHEAPAFLSSSNIEGGDNSEEQNIITKDYNCDSDDSNSISPRFDAQPQSCQNSLENLNVQIIEESETEHKIINITEASEMSPIRCTNNKLGSFALKNSSLPCSPLLNMKRYFRQKSAENVHNLEKSAAPLVFRINRRKHESSRHVSKSNTHVDMNLNLKE